MTSTISLRKPLERVRTNMMGGGDIVGILNSDDTYAESDIIEDVVETMIKAKVDSCYGDLANVDREETGKIIRYWRSDAYDRKRFKRGWMPPHPAFYVRRRVYEQYELFSPDFPIAADYELMLRFLYRCEVSTTYVPKVLVRMRSGGSSRAGLAIATRMLRENYRAWEANDSRPSVWTSILKPVL